ncbi:hypothetical protein K435DRAFT_144066 [Dendrothele bispora CBS 962.96]|uniref:Zn(2)-C6 fungal-type domain-containing protein n=1 Tax=Dendrothele bispora (strain CBS 962.96) TaxID=1314807 RepID=A0A4S8LYX5_DENBC|nr:hypothetical protein K435DRAFT_144066 [Dendrothele bispora CBS 962.96]
MTDSKRHRSRQACDACRRKKVRCETRNELPQDTCIECHQTKIECTYTMTRKKRGPRYDHAFLRSRLAQSAQALVSSILSSSTPYVPPDDKDKVREVLVELASYIRNLETELGRTRTSANASVNNNGTTSNLVVEASTESPCPSSSYSQEHPHPQHRNQNIGDGSSLPSHVTKPEDVNEVAALSKVLVRMSFESDNVNSYGRHFGKSSNIMLIKAAMDIKGEMTGEAHLAAAIFQGFKRKEFWAIHPWHVDTKLGTERYEFPEDDLLRDLIEIYFNKINVYMPLLHKPTFMKAVNEGLHHRDHHFGGLVLGLCALASRQSDDPRNAYEGIDSRLSYGWRWFRQIQLVRPSFIIKPSVYELQLYCLAAFFLKSSSIPHGTWVLTGLGIRYAQEMGAHRRFPRSQKPTIESELWKRAFWVLVVIDVLVAMLFGRPRATMTEDFDLEYPLGVDDEYWEDPEHPFEQPRGKPSLISGWIHYLKLVEIMGSVHRGIYAIRRPPWNEYGVSADDPEYDQKTVLFLDSTLNKWIDSMPEHVKWDPKNPNPLFFNQSVMLHSSYYWVQIQVHKTFIPKPGPMSSFPTSFSESDTSTSSENSKMMMSLAVCANAARSCLRILETQSREEKRFVPIPLLLPMFLTASIMLLLNIWRGTRMQACMDLRKELVDVYRCLRIVKMYETNYEIAGRLYDMLRHLIVLTRMPLPQDPELQGEAEANPRQAQTQGQTSPQLAADSNAGDPLRTFSMTQTLPSDSSGFERLGDHHDSHSQVADSIFGVPNSTNGAASSQIYPASSGTLPVHSYELGQLPMFGNIPPIDLTSREDRAQGSINNNQDADFDMVDEFLRMMEEDNAQMKWVVEMSSRNQTNGGVSGGGEGYTGTSLVEQGVAAGPGVDLASQLEFGARLGQDSTGDGFGSEDFFFSCFLFISWGLVGVLTRLPFTSFFLHS